MNIVAENTKKIIKAKGLKNKAVAHKADYTEQQFSSILNGRRIIR